MLLQKTNIAHSFHLIRQRSFCIFLKQALGLVKWLFHSILYAMKNLYTVEGSMLQQALSVLNQWAQSQVNGDFSAFKGCFYLSPELTNIGTDTDEFWMGWERYGVFMAETLQAQKGLEISQRDTRLCTNAARDVIWYSQLIDTCYETRAELTRLEGFRHSGVLLKEQDEWKIIQTHISATLAATPINA